MVRSITPGLQVLSKVLSGKCQRWMRHGTTQASAKALNELISKGHQTQDLYITNDDMDDGLMPISPRAEAPFPKKKASQ
jgi:hypothetical protein